MASAEAAIGTRHFMKAKIVDFSPELVRAPFFLRVAALCVDYMLMMAVPTLWLLLGKILGDSSATISIGSMIWAVAVIVFVVDFLLLPLITGKSVGKMVTGLTVVKMDGTEVDLSHLVLRSTIGYLASILTLGLGFLLAAVNPSGRALHDLIGGTIVVRARKALV